MSGARGKHSGRLRRAMLGRNRRRIACSVARADRRLYIGAPPVSAARSVDAARLAVTARARRSTPSTIGVTTGRSSRTGEQQQVRPTLVAFGKLWVTSTTSATSTLCCRSLPDSGQLWPTPTHTHTVPMSAGSGRPWAGARLLEQLCDNCRPPFRQLWGSCARYCSCSARGVRRPPSGGPPRLRGDGWGLAVEVCCRRGSHEAHYRGTFPAAEPTPPWTPSLEMGGAVPESRRPGPVG